MFGKEKRQIIKITKKIKKDVEEMVPRLLEAEEKLKKIETLCEAVTKTYGLIGPQGQLPMVPVAAIREILGLEPFPFEDEKKTNPVEPCDDCCQLFGIRRTKSPDLIKDSICPFCKSINDNKDKK